LYAASAVGPLLANSDGSGLTAINLPNQTMDIVGNITGNLSGSVGSVTGLTASDVAAIKAVTDLLIAAHAEPTGVPAANETPLEKLAYLFMALRNQIDITSTKKTFYDDGGAAEWEKDLRNDSR
jgi:hypothetical protein